MVSIIRTRREQVWPVFVGHDVHSRKWLSLASDQGLADAQFNLGVLYVKGLGINQNLKKALEYFRLAADQGDIRAMQSIKKKNLQENRLRKISI